MSNYYKRIAVKAIVGSIKSQYITSPSLSGNRGIPDGPLLGNGDIAVVSGGTLKKQAFHISKSDLSHNIKYVGELELDFNDSSQSVENEVDETIYSQSQNILNAQVEAVLPITTQSTVSTTSWTADNGNYLITQLSSIEGAQQPVKLTLKAMVNGGRVTSAGILDGNNGVWITRKEDETVTIATKVIGAEVTDTKSNASDQCSLRFTLPATGSVYVLSAIGGGKFSAKSTDKVIEELNAVANESDIDSLYSFHQDWWEKYWSKSYVQLNDELLMKYYYGSLYALGSGSRAGGAGMSICGPWRVDDSDLWGNDYTTNYNYEAPWWGVYSSNRYETAIPYYEGALRALPAAKDFALQKGLTGALYKTQIKQWFTLHFDWQQKSNGAYLLASFIWNYRMTLDDDFLVKTAWSLLDAIAEFWENDKNLKYSEATHCYEVLNAAAREICIDGGIAPDKNSTTDLALIKQLLSFLSNDEVISALQAGGIIISDSRTEIWKHRAENLAPLPTVQQQGKTTFSESETLAQTGKMSLMGPGDNPVVLDAVFPVNYLSLGSDPKLLEIGRNTLSMLNSGNNPTWYQANAFTRIFTQAARVGFDGETIIQKLKDRLDGSAHYEDAYDDVESFRNNLTINPNRHGIEGLAAIEAINTMLMQSHDGVIRLFPVWPKNRKAEFVHLRAYGAFLVSGSYDSQLGEVISANIKSEKGKRVVVQSPWVSGMVVTDSHDLPVKRTSKIEDNTGFTLYTFNTVADETYTLAKLNSEVDPGNSN